jgi:glycosyltransferase involved in cell wall biosynthesis
MTKPHVTALIDTYNHEAFIEKAIESVLQQDFPAGQFEILVVDDGSRDRTPALLKKFTPRVRILTKSNAGQASAFNAAIPEAQGAIVAFLDGDDWWAPGKLTAITEAFSANPQVGLIGHGITEIYSDGRERNDTLREVSQFRLTSSAAAKMFRMRKCFLGTSRMAYRAEILGQIGPVPEALKFEADEYLFTLAGLFADVMVLPQPLTCYRLHDKNLFQFTNNDPQAVRKKQIILNTLTQALEQQFQLHKVPSNIARIILECVEIEADALRLSVDNGFPWETLSTELKTMRVFHSDASARQKLFSFARLLPATVLPSRTYYRWRRQLSELSFYQSFRRRYLPFPVQPHVERSEKIAP